MVSRYQEGREMAPINLIYGIQTVNDSDLNYFLDAFTLRDDKLRNYYLETKEQVMGLQYRFSHYSPLNVENTRKNQIDSLLMRLEKWFFKSIECSKGVKILKTSVLKKKQFAICGLDLPQSRQTEISSGYHNLIYQTEVNERERQAIESDLELIRSKIVGSYPGDYNQNLRRFNEGENKRFITGGLNVLESPPYFSCKL